MNSVLIKIFSFENYVWMNNQVVLVTETIKSQEETIRSLESTLKQ